MTPKPCPFCGGAVELKHKDGNYGYTPDSVMIRCAPCDIAFHEVTEKWTREKGHFSVEQEAVERILERWNKRFDFFDL